MHKFVKEYSAWILLTAIQLRNTLYQQSRVLVFQKTGGGTYQRLLKIGGNQW